MPFPAVVFRIDFADDCNVGPGKVRLLEAIQKSGSLSRAARDLGMSYRRAWLLIESLNTSFSEPCTAAAVGGKGGGGMQVTPFGCTLIKSYRTLEVDIQQASARHLRAVVVNVGGARAGKGVVSRRSLKPKSQR